MRYALEDGDSAFGSIVRVQYLQTTASAWIRDLQYGHSFVLVAELFWLARTTATMSAITATGIAHSTSRIMHSVGPMLGMVHAPFLAFPEPGFIVASWVDQSSSEVRIAQRGYDDVPSCKYAHAASSSGVSQYLASERMDACIHACLSASMPMLAAFSINLAFTKKA